MPACWLFTCHLMWHSSCLARYPLCLPAGCCRQQAVSRREVVWHDVYNFAATILAAPFFRVVHSAGRCGFLFWHTTSHSCPHASPALTLANFSAPIPMPSNSCPHQASDIRTAVLFPFRHSQVITIPTAMQARVTAPASPLATSLYCFSPPAAATCLFPRTVLSVFPC